MDKILVTGSCGFIGMALCKRLLEKNYMVFGVDNMNSYYDPKLKVARLNILHKSQEFQFLKADISEFDEMKHVFKKFKPRFVVNLAAQAGVRFSLKNPFSYINTNVMGFMNILELCKEFDAPKLIYASSSSVYGNNKPIFSVHDKTDKPKSIYAASKKTNELMAYAYNDLYNISTVGLRFFTVYGPWGRPDMAMYMFTEKIINDKIITVFNNGDMNRAFTYIDDIICGIISSIEKDHKYEIFNLGNNHSENLMDMISIIEQSLGKKAKLQFADMQLGDVKYTDADISYSEEKLGYKPNISIKEGIPKFVKWYKEYHDLLE